jgi:histidinol-phosphatase (PHP family)
MDYHYIVEINTKSWVPRNRFFPNLKYFGMLKKYNAPVVFNSDSHYPTMIDAGREEAMKLYDML